jgi:carbon monoxide dehydrogenase subunit G
MAMTMAGEATLPAPRPKVWALLNDPAVLKASIPGCESLEKTGDNGFAAVAKVKVGPVAATFKGKVQLSDIVPNVGYTITGEGEGGVAGFAKGGAKVSLADVEGGTLLRYDVEAHVGGKLAQLGSRLIDGVAKGMADKFFANFAAAAASAAGTTIAAASASATPPIKPPTPAATPASPAAASVASSSAQPKPMASASATPQAIPVKKSWFRRIWEWFMSR